MQREIHISATSRYECCQLLPAWGHLTESGNVCGDLTSLHFKLFLDIMDIMSSELNLHFTQHQLNSNPNLVSEGLLSEQQPTVNHASLRFLLNLKGGNMLIVFHTTTPTHVTHVTCKQRYLLHHTTTWFMQEFSDWKTLHSITVWMFAMTTA